MLFIYHLFQAAYHNAKPQLLKQQLQNIELEDGKVFIIFCGVLIPYLQLLQVWYL